MSKEILKNIIDNFNITEFTHFFRSKNRSGFAPRTEDLSDYSDDNFSEGSKIGEIRFDDEEFIICSFMVLKSLTERSGKKVQYELGRKILKEKQADAGIFIFYDDQDKFRFSLIYTNYLGKKRDWSNYHRFTYFVHKNITNKTFLDRIGNGDFSSLKNIKAAFSVEPLNKEFYEELSNWYFWALKIVEFPDDTEKDIDIRNATSTIRLITRLIFVWFMKQKNIITDALFQEEELAKILNNKDQTGSTYYKAILQNLFFATLNTKMGYDNRKFVANQKGIQEYYRYERFFKDKKRFLELTKDIPFLNGGLFENLDIVDTKKNNELRIDCFSNDPNNENRLKVPDVLFFGGDIVDLSKDYDLASYRRTTVLGIIKILRRYNFTIDENTPDDVEVALDPELLGLVFENLLASYNPETKKTARKATGSYYTPRDIVNYMADESLKYYLKTELLKENKSYIKVGDQQTNILDNQASKGQLPLNESHGSSDWKSHAGKFEKNIYLLFNTLEEQPFTDEKTKSIIIQAIDKCKIIDPACGSGAFPMGILQKMVFLLHKLDPENKYWKEIQYQKALKETEETFNLGDKGEREKRLKAINEAFDLNINEPDYARKLYLIENCIFGVDIQPIAVQIAKLRVFISLLVDQKLNPEKENLGILSLPNLETKFVAADSLVGLEKQKSLQIPDIAPLEEELADIRHKYFSAKSATKKLEYRQLDKNIRGNIAPLLESSGWSKTDANNINQWDPYDQNSYAKWFDPEWMFSIKDKFDIVIGNPPYGIDLPELRNKYSLGSDNSYGIFMVFAINELLKKHGILSFIVSDTWLTIKSHFELREKILSKQIIKLIRLHQDCFNAMVNAAIFVLTNSKNQNNKIITADLTNISTRTEKPKLNEKLLEIDRSKNIITSKYAIFIYNQNVIRTNSNSPIFVANPKTLTKLSDVNVPKLSHFIFEICGGIKSYNNKKYIKSINGSGRYKQVNKKLILKRELTENEKRNGIKLTNANDPHFLEFEKGGVTLKDNLCFNNYYYPTKYYFPWDSKTVNTLSRINGLRNRHRYFSKGIGVTAAGVYSPLFRLTKLQLFQNGFQVIFSKNQLDDKYLIGILSSKLIRYIFNNFINHTVNSNAQDVKEIPIVYDKDYEGILIEHVDSILNHLKEDKEYNFNLYEQAAIDKIIYKLYNLNDEDKIEVETWFARRYPKLAKFADI